MKKAKILSCILAMLMCFSLISNCGQKLQAEAESAPGMGFKASLKSTPGTADETWAVYLYMCGSDLESENGFATDNLIELDYPSMPENMKIVIETGGASQWQNNRVNPEYLQRWEMNETGLISLADLPVACMGEEATLEDFLKFCRDNYPADKTMFMIWDHGGGTCYGACVDENYPGSSSLSIHDIHDAVKNVFGSSEDNPPLDILTFDCCLMSTLDVAELFKDEAAFLLASEELVPGGGLNYDSFIQAFRDNPAIEPAELGVKMVEGYWDKYIASDRNGTVTLALTDLSRVSAVSSAVDTMFGDLLKMVYDDPDFFVDISILAGAAENYGGNSRAQGYTNLVDIRDFADECLDYVPSAKAVIDAVDNAVVCRTSGDYRAYAGGLSMVYNYNASENCMNRYLENGTSDALKAFLAVTDFSVVPDSQKDYVKGLGLDAEVLPAIKTFRTLDTSNKGVKLNSEGNYYVDFGPEVGICTTDVMYELYYVGDDGLYYLGSDDEIDPDFNEGIFICNFGGKWMQLGNWIACMELEFDSDEYNIYSMPILVEELDDDILYMQVGYDFETGAWEELGVRTSNAEPGTAKSFTLDDGTVFGVLQPTLRDDGSLQYNLVAELEYSPDIWNYSDLPDGDYMMCFRLEDVHRDVLYSDAFEFRIADGVPVY